MKETEVEKIRQIISRTDITANQKVILIVTLFDSLNKEPDLKSFFEVERLESGYIIVENGIKRTAANNEDCLIDKTNIIMEKSVGLLDKLYYSTKASKVEVNIEIKITNK
jgi:hypothetical protein